MTKDEATKIIYCATHGKKCDECPMLKTCHGDINPNIDDCCETYVTDAAEALCSGDKQEASDNRLAECRNNLLRAAFELVDECEKRR